MTDESTSIGRTATAPDASSSALGSTLRGPWGLAALAACECAATAIMDPTEHRMSVACPFQVVTGWWCPFCGATRSVSRLVRGDLGGALRYNALLVAVLPIVALIWWTHAVPSTEGWRASLRGRTQMWAAAGAVLALLFTVVRNVPVEPLTQLRFPGA